MGLFDLTAIRSAARTLTEQVRGLRAEIEQQRRKRDEIETAPAARADVKAALQRSIAAGADRYAQQLRGHLDPMIRKAHMLGEPQRVEAAFSLLGVGARGEGTPTVKAHDALLAAMVGPLVSRALADMVDSMEWPADEGLPLAQRAVELDKLDRRIAELAAQESQLVAEARAAGLILED